ncbi:unnamed protein product, partial [Iphiclides podalirius]
MTQASINYGRGPAQTLAWNRHDRGWRQMCSPMTPPLRSGRVAGLQLAQLPAIVGGMSGRRARAAVARIKCGAQTRWLIGPPFDCGCATARGCGNRFYRGLCHRYLCSGGNVLKSDWM